MEVFKEEKIWLLVIINYGNFSLIKE